MLIQMLLEFAKHLVLKIANIVSAAHLVDADAPAGEFLSFELVLVCREGFLRAVPVLVERDVRNCRRYLHPRLHPSLLLDVRCCPSDRRDANGEKAQNET